ncbi:MAG TPA: type II CRISPR-associated endonuclease Cas1 [Chthonomonadales bacterium]|nr:type II CRISPR-associated endonuclease Cas1 [Chthonomonadales bacterium]
MTARIVEIGSPAALVYRDGHLRIERAGGSVALVPIEDLGVLVLDQPQVTLTAPLLTACAEANVAVVVCDARHTPTALLSPFEGNTLHLKVLRGQVEAGAPVKKRLWQTIVRAKICAQAGALKRICGEDFRLGALAAFVRSGDPENVESRAARAYFHRLFGDGFVRDRYGQGVNQMLNYGYAIVRAAVARAIVGAGLHPALAVHHSNQYNPFALADDLVEPLRPLVDVRAHASCARCAPADGLSQAARHSLLEVLTDEVDLGGRRYPIMTAVGLYAATFRDCLLGEERHMICPAWPE